MRVMKTALMSTAILSCVAAPAYAQDDSEKTFTIEEIMVTARMRGESLQKVPDSITAFTAADIQAAGIDNVQDFIDMVPNVIMRKTFRSGLTFITIRGITSGAQGWPPISYVVDGVKAASLDSINQGALLDIERLEILKGPQGALYGAGAIGGAINVITTKPTNDLEGKITASYGKGNDIALSGAVSGALVEDKLLFRVSGYFNDADGLVNTTDGEDIDFRNMKTIRGRLIFTPSDDLSFDLRAAFVDSKGGSVMQDKVATPDLIDEFRTASAPGPVRRLGFLGREDREFVDISLKADWDMGFATFTGVVAYQDLGQDLFGPVNFGKPPLPAGQTVFGSPLYGDAALPGQPIDEFQDLTDDYETWSADFRLTSNSDQRLRWIVGAEVLSRKSLVHLGAGHIVAPAPGDLVYLTNRYDDKKDEMWGIYGQISYDIVENLELTVAARYDENKYSNGRVTDATGNTPIQAIDPSGNLVDRLYAKDSKFQPKVQLAYSWSDDFMTYATYSEGFRSGFFTTGNLTLPETTKNHEAGFKSQWWDGRLTLNAAAFYTKYSDQQVTLSIAVPPFRTTQNIPATDIYGLEADFVIRPTEKLLFSFSAGYTDAEVKNGTRAPTTPKWTVNSTIQWTEPLTDELDFIARVDYRHQSPLYLRPNNVFQVGAKDYVNARVSFETENYGLRFYVENLTNTQQATSFSAFAGSYARSYDSPRSYGVEASYKF